MEKVHSKGKRPKKFSSSQNRKATSKPGNMFLKDDQNERWKVWTVRRPDREITSQVAEMFVDLLIKKQNSSRWGARCGPETTEKEGKAENIAEQKQELEEKPYSKRSEIVKTDHFPFLDLRDCHILVIFRQYKQINQVMDRMKKN